jgi:DNA-binding CsgD family transcriptional regulator
MKPSAKSPSEVRVSDFELNGRQFSVLSFAERPRSASKLTAAELAVALLALQGLSNREIADLRKAALPTVSNQLASIYRKLGVGSRAELAARWT